MKIKAGQEEAYAAYKEKNSHDPYSYGVVTYTERWADFMEKLLEKGAKLEDIAKESSHSADTEGITGFMYGCAVSALARFWEHGEDLRKWHNKEHNRADLNEKEGGGTANPAVLTIGTKE